VEIVSFNAFAFGDIAAAYPSLGRFIEAGNMVSWGIVPTLFEEFTKEDVTSIARRLMATWRLLEEKGVSMDAVCRNSLIAPATCNLLNVDKTATVENAFRLVGEVSEYLKAQCL
jgi:hypothetical protein